MATATGSRRPDWARGRKRREYGGKFDTEYGATGLRRCSTDFSGVFLDNSETDAQAQARSLSDRFRCVKRIENAMRLFDARTSVGKKNDDVAAIASRLDGEYAAFMGFHRIDSVVDEVEENLHELIAVAANSGENGLELQFDSRLLENDRASEVASRW